MSAENAKPILCEISEKSSQISLDEEKLNAHISENIDVIKKEENIADGQMVIVDSKTTGKDTCNKSPTVDTAGIKTVESNCENNLIEGNEVNKEMDLKNTFEVDLMCQVQLEPVNYIQKHNLIPDDDSLYRDEKIEMKEPIIIPDEDSLQRDEKTEMKGVNIIPDRDSSHWDEETKPKEDNVIADEGSLHGDEKTKAKEENIIADEESSHRDEEAKTKEESIISDEESSHQTAEIEMKEVEKCKIEKEIMVVNIGNNTNDFKKVKKDAKLENSEVEEISLPDSEITSETERSVEVEQEIQLQETKSNSNDVIENLTKVVNKEIVECKISADSSKVNIEDSKLSDSLIHKVNMLEISENDGQIDCTVNESSVILNKTTDSLKNLMAYRSDGGEDTDTTDEEDDKDDVCSDNGHVGHYPKARDEIDSEIESEAENLNDSDSDSDVSIENIFDKDKQNGKNKEKNGTIKSKGELDMEDLPPVPDVSKIVVDMQKDEFLHIGIVEAIVCTIVTIKALPGTPGYDLETCLFCEIENSIKPLGTIYDVIGPIHSPIYCVRFNTTKDIEDLNIKEGMKIFSMPKGQYTHYIYLHELLANKGSDASWLGDNEMPPEVAAELSDDDCDTASNFSQPRYKPKKRKHSSLERHKEFEQSMNHCNTLNTRGGNLVNTHHNWYGSNSPSPRKIPTNNHTFRLPVIFDPTVPPPGFQGCPGFSANSYPVSNPRTPRPFHQNTTSTQHRAPSSIPPRQMSYSWHHTFEPGPSTQEY